MLLMGKSTIYMAIFDSYVTVPEGNFCQLKNPAWDDDCNCIDVFFFQMGGLTTNQLLIDFRWQNCIKLPCFIPNLPKYQKLGSFDHGQQTRLGSAFRSPMSKSKRRHAPPKVYLGCRLEPLESARSIPAIVPRLWECGGTGSCWRLGNWRRIKHYNYWFTSGKLT